MTEACRQSLAGTILIKIKIFWIYNIDLIHMILVQSCFENGINYDFKNILNFESKCVLPKGCPKGQWWSSKPRIHPDQTSRRESPDSNTAKCPSSWKWYKWDTFVNVFIVLNFISVIHWFSDALKMFVKIWFWLRYKF